MRAKVQRACKFGMFIVCMFLSLCSQPHLIFRRRLTEPDTCRQLIYKTQSYQDQSKSEHDKNFITPGVF